MPRDLAPVVPAYVQVWFRSAQCGPADPDTKPKQGPPPPPYYSVSIALGKSGSAIGTSVTGNPNNKIVHDAAYALFDFATGGLGDPTNKADLVKLATAIAKDFYSWRATRYDRVYNGVLEWAPEGLTDCVEWSYVGGDDTTPGDCTTRAMTGPFNGEPEEAAHDLGQCAACDVLRLKVYGPPITFDAVNRKLFVSVYYIWLGERGDLEYCTAPQEELDFCGTTTGNAPPSGGTQPTTPTVPGGSG